MLRAVKNSAAFFVIVLSQLFVNISENLFISIHFVHIIEVNGTFELPNFTAFFQSIEMI